MERSVDIIEKELDDFNKSGGNDDEIRMKLKDEIELELQRENSSVNARQRRKFKRFLENIEAMKAQPKSLDKKEDAKSNDGVPDKFSSLKEIFTILDKLSVPDKSKMSPSDFLEASDKILVVLKDLEESKFSNKNTRRRISRMKFALLSGSDQNTSSQNPEVISDDKVRSSNPKKSIGCFDAVLSASTAEELENSIAGVMLDSLSSEDIANCGLEVVERINKITNGEVESIHLPSKIKRKAARFADQLNDLVKLHSSTTNEKTGNEPLAQADTSMDHQLETSDISSKRSVIGSQKKIIDYGALLRKLKNSENPEEIDKCLAFVRLNLEEVSRNPGVRKALVERKPKFEEILDVRTMKKLNNLLKRLDSDELSSTVTNTGVENTNGQQEPPGDWKKGPCIAFLGQLSYDTSADDIEEFIRNHGVEGSLSIRLLTNSQTGKSKGMAFVECEGPRELNKVLSLHHTSLQGRKINVEKSCGGRNKQQRSARLEDMRQEQYSKLKESVKVCLQEYEDKNVISMDSIDEDLLHMFYSHPVPFTRSVLDKFSEMSPDMRTINDLIAISHSQLHNDAVVSKVDSLKRKIDSQILPSNKMPKV